MCVHARVFLKEFRLIHRKTKKLYMKKDEEESRTLVEQPRSICIF